MLKRPQVAVEEPEQQEPTIGELEAKTVEDLINLCHEKPWNRNRAKAAVILLQSMGFTRDEESEAIKKNTAVLVLDDIEHKKLRYMVTVGRHWRDVSKMAVVLSAQPTTEYRIKVRAYMTKPAMDGFDLMKKWNHDTPMPMRVMFGRVLEETKGMYRVELHGKPEPTITCLHCGRTLTNHVSQLYGIGPICLEKYFSFAAPRTEEELEEHKEEIRVLLESTTWTGWIPKSAIELMEEAGE